jgi:hypothetical protein
MFKLSDTPVKEEYKANAGKDVLLGKHVVRVLLKRSDTKSGSWERGFKFGSITYGVLQRKHPPSQRGSGMVDFSFDHGATWNVSILVAKKAKGKVIVERSTPRGEFAFDSIQKINRDYDPYYKWKA